jgi:hypothetical protein
MYDVDIEPAILFAVSIVHALEAYEEHVKAPVFYDKYREMIFPLQGSADESVIPPVRRPNSYHSGSSPLLENFKVENLLPGLEGGNSSPEDWA